MGSTIPFTIRVDPSPVPRPRKTIFPPLYPPRACIAASLTTFTGRPNAAAKSNPTHPRPRLYGSAIGQPCKTGPAYPIDTTSYVQPRASFSTPDTICLGVNVGPDGNERSSVCPVAMILTEVPPTSTTNTFPAADAFATSARSCRTRRRWAGRDVTFTALARSLEYG